MSFEEEVYVERVWAVWCDQCGKHVAVTLTNQEAEEMRAEHMEAHPV